ncbi:MAG: hypothetical protein AAF654_03425 [Myxococcota bacterium]
MQRLPIALLLLVSCGDDDVEVSPREPVPGTPVAVAIATPTAALESTTIALDGALSTDSAGEALSYAWEQTSGPAAAIGDPAAASTTLTLPSVDENRSIALTLTVTNTNGVTNSDSVFVTVIDGGIVPVADAGMEQSVNALETVILTGSGSSDADGTIATYLWERLSGPAITLSDGANPSDATFAAPDVTEPSILLLQLTVTDDSGLRASSTVRIDVEPVPAALAFTAVPEPAAVLRNTPFDPIAVEVQNAAGERIVDGTGAVIEVNLVADKSGALQGPVAVSTEAGTVALTETSYDTVETEVTLTASAAGLTPATLTVDVEWPSAFPGFVPAALGIESIVQVPGIPPDMDPPPTVPDDAIVIATLNGTADLDLSGTAPLSVTSTEEDLLLVRYRQDGSVVWHRHFSAASAQRAVAASRTNDGDIVVLFSLAATIDLAREPPAQELTASGPFSAALIRFDAISGDVEWQTRFGGAATVTAEDLVLATNGDVYVVGSFSGELDPEPAGGTELITSDGVDAMMVKLRSPVLDGSDTTNAALDWFLAPSITGDERLTSATLAENGDLVAGGSQGNPEVSAWVYRANAAGTVTSDFTFAGTAAPTAIRDIESRGTSVQVAGVFSGDCDFNGTETLTSAGGTDGFFAVFTSAGDELAFVRTITSAGDASIRQLVRTEQIEASFVFAGEISADATFNFGLTPESVVTAAPVSYLLIVGFDGQIKRLSTRPASTGHRLFSQPDDSVWTTSTLQINTAFDADPFTTSVTLTGSINDSLVLHLDPDNQRLVP